MKERATQNGEPIQKQLSKPTDKSSRTACSILPFSLLSQVPTRFQPPEDRSHTHLDPCQVSAVQEHRDSRCCPITNAGFFCECVHLARGLQFFAIRILHAIEKILTVTHRFFSQNNTPFQLHKTGHVQGWVGTRVRCQSDSHDCRLEENQTTLAFVFVYLAPNPVPCVSALCQGIKSRTRYNESLAMRGFFAAIYPGSKTKRTLSSYKCNTPQAPTTRKMKTLSIVD